MSLWPDCGKVCEKDEIANGAPQRLGARRRHGRVDAAGKDCDRHRAGAQILGRLHRVAQQQPDRQPGIMVGRERGERIERRDEDQAVERPVTGEIGGHPAADAQADRDGAPGMEPLAQMIVDEERILLERRRPGLAGARRVAAIVEGGDIRLREQPVQIFGGIRRIPGIAGEADDQQPWPRPRFGRRDMDAAQDVARRRRAARAVRSRAAAVRPGRCSRRERSGPSGRRT